MKRSQINQIIRQADEFIRRFGYRLPPFAYYTADELLKAAQTSKGIFSARLGWDVTDYGAGSFHDMGLVLFTLRNGSTTDLTKGRGKSYAEKIMISRRDQIAPMHRHIVKIEDIINRGGGRLAIRMFTTDTNGDIDENQDVIVACDGAERRLKAGGVLLLNPGESVTLFPGNWHEFWGEGGDVLIGEVSTVNDDRNDNIFKRQINRFANVTEDEAPLHLLVSDYEAFLNA